MTMPSTLPLRTFAQFREAVYAFRIPRIIMSALELELFSSMGNQAWTVSALAKRLRVSQRGLDIILRNVASIGLVKATVRGYQAHAMAQRYLNKHSPDFRGDYLQLIQRQWEEWAQLTAVVKTGRPLDDDAPETPEYRQSFSWAMHQRSLESAKHVSEQLSLGRAQTLLDFGGGPGTYALHFLKRNPTLQATVMDRPAALEVAKTLAARYRLQTRMSFLPCDFINEPIVGHYDVAWYSNVLHIYSAQENLAIFRKLRRRLASGGRILIQDTFLQDPKGLVPVEANVFAVTMLLHTQTGNTYSLRDVQDWLKRAGFARTKVLRMKPGTGDWNGQILEGRISATSRKRK